MLLTDEGRQRISEIAGRHGFSPEATEVMLGALLAGNGTQAQFSHPEFGGMGQWSPGMIMIGDMFNSMLKARVDSLAQELSGLVSSISQYVPPPPAAPAGQFQSGQFQSGQFQSQGGGGFFAGSPLWPAELGQPGSSGSQNDMQYAIFPGTRRLAIRRGGVTEIYDTGDHMIGGISQQQGGSYNLSFTSQFGAVSLENLRRVDQPAAAPAPAPTAEPAPAPAAVSAPEPVPEPTPEPVAPEPAPAAAPEPEPAASVTAPDAASAATPVAGAPAPAGGVIEADIFAKIEQLHGLFSRGILSKSEYETKKSELLSRL